MAPTPPRGASPQPDPHLAPHPAPRLVIDGRYELLEPIGSGGMGEVWKAHDRRLRRFVAVKGLLDRNAMTPGTQAAAMRRARREAEAIAKIEHQNVVTVHDQVETDNQVWIVMKLLEARSLADLLRAERVLAVPRAADIGLQILQGLRAVHAASVVHRDVKPGNVLVHDNGRVVLVDFGIATFEGATQVTRSGSVIGTPPYLAPELFAPVPRPTPPPTCGHSASPCTRWSRAGSPSRAARCGRSRRTSGTPRPGHPVRGPARPVIQGLLFPDPADRLDAATAEAMLREVQGEPPAPHTPGPSRPPTRRRPLGTRTRPRTHPRAHPVPEPLGPPVPAATTRPKRPAPG